MGESQKAKHNYFKSAAAISVVSAFSLMFSFVQESVFAFFYGADATTDAYNIAIQIPVTLFALISTAISTVVIPCYSNRFYKHGKDSARHYASNFMTVVSAVTIVAIVLGEIFAHFVLLVFAPGMASATRDLAELIFRLVLPTILLTELMNINTGIMNVHKSFILPTLTSNILNVIFVTSVFSLAARMGIFAAVIGTIVGTILEFVYSVLIRRKYVKYKYIFDLKDKEMRSSIKMAGPVFIGIGAAEINKIIDRVVASFLSEGSISMLNYASKLSSAVSTLFITGITTVVFPEFAEKTAKEDDQGVAEVLITSIKMLAIIILPIIAGGFVLGEDIIKIVYGRGKFSLNTVYKTTPLFVCYLVSLIFVSTRQVCSRLFYSYKDSKTPMKNSIIGIIINIILNVALGRIMGALGLAVATTVSSAVITALLLVDAKKKNAYIEYKKIGIIIFKLVIACAIMAIAIAIIKKILIEKNFYDLTNFKSTIICFAISLVTGIGIYYSMLLLLRVEEIRKIVGLIKRRKRN